jgi:tRNA(Ile2) C34 agmatinyltransferase TiaS
MGNKFKKICPKCKGTLKFYPGCCGNLPLWRCEKCGLILKWSEKQTEADRYLKLK